MTALSTVLQKGVNLAEGGCFFASPTIWRDCLFRFAEDTDLTQAEPHLMLVCADGDVGQMRIAVGDADPLEKEPRYREQWHHIRPGIQAFALRPADFVIGRGEVDFTRLQWARFGGYGLPQELMVWLLRPDDECITPAAASGRPLPDMEKLEIPTPELERTGRSLCEFHDNLILAAGDDPGLGQLVLQFDQCLAQFYRAQPGINLLKDKVADFARVIGELRRSIADRQG